MKRLLTALLALLGLLGAPACFAIGPYLTGRALPAGELPVLMAQIEQKLRAGYMKAIERQVRSDRLSAENLRAKVLY